MFGASEWNSVTDSPSLSAETTTSIAGAGVGVGTGVGEKAGVADGNALADGRDYLVPDDVKAARPLP